MYFDTKDTNLKMHEFVSAVAYCAHAVGFESDPNHVLILFSLSITFQSAFYC